MMTLSCAKVHTIDVKYPLMYSFGLDLSKLKLLETYLVYPLGCLEHISYTTGLRQD